MGQKNFSKKKPLAKNLGVKFFWQPGEHGPCRPSAWLWQNILPQQRLFGTKLSMISTLDDICWKWSKRASNTSIVASLYRLTSTASRALEPRPANARHSAKQKCINTCRARYRDCLSLKQIPSSECRGIYQDCTRYTCNAGPGRPSWPGFPSYSSRRPPALLARADEVIE